MVCVVEVMWIVEMVVCYCVVEDELVVVDEVV